MEHDEAIPECKGCKHWHKVPLDPQDLGAGPKGDCRAHPPQSFAVPSRMGLQIASAYPVLPATFPACSLFLKARGILLEGN